MSTTIKKELLKGGEFLVKESTPEQVFTREDLTEEQEMFRQMARDFVDKRVLPQIDAIDNGGYDIVKDLLDEAGELGILGAEMPQEYGGMGVDFNTGTVLAEEIGGSHSFGVAVAAHTGIGTLPILYYGTEEQKKKYLPGVSTGKLKAAYCLTEPNAGSDALSGRTKAILSDDGKYYLITGQKMWITNSGFADLFIVFAKVDGDKFTGFIVDAKSEGITLGAEERKMGIKGSSTRQVFFENVKVPVENVLGEIGKGHKIAFNVLNIGRYKLGAMVTGGAKRAVTLAVRYANERVQFGVPIASFGAIQHKLAEMAIRTFVCESAVYRTSGLINDMINAGVEAGLDQPAAKLQAAEEYSIEAAMLKVYGSEMLDYVVDETVQIFGGNGYSEEYPASRAYRDSRINRIFEGTNEINRLLSIGMLMKKAMRGKIDLMTPAMAIQKELMSVPTFGDNGDEGVFSAEKRALRNAKKAFLLVAGAAVQKFMQDLEKQQEIVSCAADVLMELYACESALLRTEKMLARNGNEHAALYVDMVKTYFSDAMERINLAGKHAICGFAEGDELKMMLMGLKRYTKYEPFNTIAARRRIAKALIEANEYCF